MFAFIAFAIVLMILITYFYYRDKGIVKQLELYEMAIDDLNVRLHKVEQEGDEKSTNIENIENFSNELDKIEENLSGKLDELSDPLLKTIRAIKDMEVEIKRIEDSVNDRINKLEENTKLSSMSNNAKLINEKAIVELYKAGYSAEEIAKRERTPIGEVELILRIANLR
jgi:DNA-directed RNA polymerase specialized sigma24 family protein